MNKPELDREELRDVIDLALWAGQMLLQNGADAERVEETVQSIGTKLGAGGVDALVSPNALIITTTSGAEFRTKVRRITHLGVNLATVEAISHLNHRDRRWNAGSRRRARRTRTNRRAGA